MKNLTDISLFLSRLAVGVIFTLHGGQKLFGMFGGSGMEGFTQMVAGLGFPIPSFWAYAAALSEFGGGVLLILGIIPRISAGLIAITMLVAILKVHGASGFFMKQGGFEYPFLILFVCLSLTLSGSGKLSLYDKF